MIRLIGIICLVAAALAAQEAPPEAGSVRGRVVDATTGGPLEGVEVWSLGLSDRVAAVSDSDGRYKLENVRPGLRPVRISYSTSHPYSGARTAAVEAGKETAGVDFELYSSPSISGRITDANDEPVAGAEVSILGREYFMGEVRYYRRGLAMTDDRGQYLIEYRFWDPGPGVLLWVQFAENPIEPYSVAPSDPAERRPTFVPTYFPNATRPEEATVIHLAPGEQKEGVDVQLLQSESYCIEAQTDASDGFLIQPAQPSFGLHASGGIAKLPSGGRLGDDSRLRLCGLARGDYVITTYEGKVHEPTSLGVATVSITDEDVTELQIAAPPQIPLSGRTLWAGEAPSQPIEARLAHRLYSLRRSMGAAGAAARSGVPDEFALKATWQDGSLVDPVLEESVLTVSNLPAGVYLKDILYGGGSVLHRPFVVGSEMAGVGLQVILDHDGGTLAARVSRDEDGPFGDVTVAIIPKAAATHLRLSETRAAGLADQTGVYVSPALEPGEYFVLATEGNFTDKSPDTIAALFDARSRAEEVNIGPNSEVSIDLQARRLGR